jgi:hypothetical protein
MNCIELLLCDGLFLIFTPISAATFFNTKNFVEREYNPYHSGI